MNVEGFEFREVDLRTGDDDLYLAMHLFANQQHAEILPEDPPMAIEERIAGWRNRPDLFAVETWVACDASGKITACAIGQYAADAAHNRHLLHFRIEVLSGFRRRGLGRALLGRIVDLATRTSRPLLITLSVDRVPAGEAFLIACGAEKGMEGHGNQLLLDEVDPELIRQWIARAPRDRFELGVWEADYPEDLLPSVVELWRIMNDAPRGRLEVEDSEYTAERVRATERMWSATGNLRRTLYVRERTTGQLVGFTEVYWSPRRPTLLSQGPTGVRVEFRGQGLGRWLKAEMMLLVRRDFPQVRIVRTGNSDLNEPMLKINRELGFQPHIASTAWQLRVERAREFARSRGAPGGDP